MQRGGYGGEGGGMAHSPSFSQPHSPMSGSEGGKPPGSTYPNSAAYENRNGSNPSGSANKNSSSLPNNGADAGAAYADKNKSNSTLPNNGAGAAGAAYANRNNSNSALPNNGAGLAGAAYANNNINRYGHGNYGAAAAIGAGYWNGNNSGYGFGTGIGAWNSGSAVYAYGYSSYSNPYSGSYSGNANVAVADNGNAGNYSQPLSTTAPEPPPAAADQSTSAFAQARDAFKEGQYGQAQQLVNQALGQTPNDPTLHQFLALTLIAQGNYEMAAAPLYAALSVGPGWNWTTLSGMYPDVNTFTSQLRALESYCGTNPGSAQARFALGYLYLCEGLDANAAAQFRTAAKLQPSDTLSAQLVAQYQPAGSAEPAPPPPAEAATGVQGTLPGQWSARPAEGVKVALAIRNDGSFTWAVSAPGKPATTISGTSSFGDGMLTLASSSGPSGVLVGKVTWQDADHFTFKLAGGPPTDPGLKFAR